MDINSLLSPARDSPPRATPPSTTAPSQRASATTTTSSKGGAQGSTAPHGIVRRDTPTLPTNALIQAQHTSPPSLNSASTLSSSRTAGHSSVSTPSGDARNAYTHLPQPVMSPHLAKRQGSSHLDTLADLATMHQQSPWPAPTSFRNTDFRESLHSPSTSTPPLVMRNPSVVSNIEGTGNEGPTAILQPRDFVATSVSKKDLNAISDLTTQIAENSYLYEAHVRLINLLHLGFIAHIRPQGEMEADHHPSTYPLLEDLRQAREAMNSRFPVGETLWLDWIQDECILASSVEEKIAVIELCKKAVQDEVGSPALWRIYGDWTWFLHRTSHDVSSVYEQTSLESNEDVARALASLPLSEDDRLICQELFKWELMMEVWEEGANSTQWHINDSQMVWTPYIELLTYDLNVRTTAEKLRNVRDILTNRLRQTHASWDETFQAFSELISRYDNASYESIMLSVNHQSSKAKQQYDLRRNFEQGLERATLNEDKEEQYNVISDYVAWEYAQHWKKNAPKSSFDMLMGLSERANLLFPTSPEFWEDHVDLLMDNPKASHALLAVTERATRHCPWSGSLWVKRFYALEAADQPFEIIEETKHHATSTGLLEAVGGMEELIQVYTAWCGFLRRRAFSPMAGEDERDIAEVGIRSAIENVKEIGEKKYGKDFKGDLQFRVEKIYFKFLAQTGAIEEARKVWRKLTLTHGDQYEFWERYYWYEMVLWGKNVTNGIASSVQVPNPVHATLCLQQAVRRPNMDWPEKIIDLYLHHCGQHESIKKLLEAHVEARRASKQVAKRRAKEAADAQTSAQGFAGYSLAAQKEDHDVYQNEESTKRKRDVDHEPNPHQPAKKARQTETSVSGPQESINSTQEPKRDREHTTIIVSNLPHDCTETKLKQFFRDCGEILDINLVANDDTSASKATIEFTSKEDALTAQTKSMKKFEGREIEVQFGLGTQLFVANYPPQADENYIRDLFKDFGDIVDVRFPSLKGNTHRRFCYVQFATARQATNATQLDGKHISGGLVLYAKISDPSAKKKRDGPMHEGRELYVGNLHFGVSQEELKKTFAQFGVVETVRIPRNRAGRPQGSAFVVFESKHEAEAGLALNLKEIKGRIIKVELSAPQGAKRTATTFIGSISPEPQSSRAGSVDSALSINVTVPKSDDYYARTLALMNVPDTVNDARIRALMESHGALKKVSLRPDHEGAIVEFENKLDKNKAGLAVDGLEIVPGRHITIGEVRDLMQVRLEKKSSSSARETSKIFQTMAPISRPGIGRRGGKGGLGFKRSDPAGRSANTKDKDEETGEKAIKAGPKSNADFRAMLERKSD